MEDALRKLAEEHGLSSGKVFQPLRVALVGQLASPGIFDVLMVLGREQVARAPGRGDCVLTVGYQGSGSG